jgi:PIN domain nuclease of toxin-antitoxin system
VTGILLDTHVFLWLQTEPERVSAAVLGRMADPTTEAFLSAASAWEIAIKHASGRLPLPVAPAEYVPARMQLTGLVPLPVTHAHAMAAGALPRLHADPFDRMLVAQAQIEGLTLATADPSLLAYGVDILGV